MPTIITGSSRADDVLQSGLVLDMEAETAWLDDDTYLFEYLLRKLGQGEGGSGMAANGTLIAKRMKHEFRERRLEPNNVSTTSATAAAATTIAVTNPEYFHTDQVIHCPATEEVFLMNEVTGGTGTAGSITVVNKAGSGGITTAIPSGSILLNLGEAHAEGEAIPAAWMVKETDLDTYLYQFDRTNQITDILDAEENYGVNEIVKQRKQFWIEQKRALNLMLYLGQNTREIVSAGGPRRHIMRGLIEWLDNSAIDASTITGGLTMGTLGVLMRPTKNHTSSSQTKLGILGQNAWTSVSNFPEGTVRVKPGKMQEWGVTLKQLNTSFGDLLVGTDPTLTAENALAGEMFILDPKHIRQLEMQKLPLRLKLNTGDNTDIHNITDVMTGTRGLIVKLEEDHRRIYGVTQ